MVKRFFCFSQYKMKVNVVCVQLCSMKACKKVYILTPIYATLQPVRSKTLAVCLSDFIIKDHLCNLLMTFASPFTGNRNLGKQNIPTRNIVIHSATYITNLYIVVIKYILNTIKTIQFKCNTYKI